MAQNDRTWPKNDFLAVLSCWVGLKGLRIKMIQMIQEMHRVKLFHHICPLFIGDEVLGHFWLEAGGLGQNL